MRTTSRRMGLAFFASLLLVGALLPAAVAAPLLLEEEEIAPSEMDRVQAELPQQPHLDGVTPSDDWAYDDPEDYSAPV